MRSVQTNIISYAVGGHGAKSAFAHLRIATPTLTSAKS
jgi:hypothetical protein